jgi:hypothetical protein
MGFSERDNVKTGQCGHISKRRLPNLELLGGHWAGKHDTLG